MLDVAIMSISIVPCFLKAHLDNEDLEASSTSLPPDIASRRRDTFQTSKVTKRHPESSCPSKTGAWERCEWVYPPAVNGTAGGMFLYSVSHDQRLIDQIEDQQSLAMNRALNIMP